VQRAQLAETRGAAGRPGGTAATVWVAADAPDAAPPRPVAVRAGLTDGTFTEILPGSALQPGQDVIVGQERTPPSSGGLRPF
jgi:multidrug efflux pump subunit AcrA (membrane-fusion protein)